MIKEWFGNVVAIIKTIEGDMKLRASDYLVKGVAKRILPLPSRYF